MNRNPGRHVLTPFGDKTMPTLTSTLLCRCLGSSRRSSPALHRKVALETASVSARAMRAYCACHSRARCHVHGSHFMFLSSRVEPSRVVSTEVNGLARHRRWDGMSIGAMFAWLHLRHWDASCHCINASWTQHWMKDVRVDRLATLSLTARSRLVVLRPCLSQKWP